MFSQTLARLKLRILSKSFDKKDYLEAYTASTDLKAQIDPGMAIGGLWDEMGRHQFEFLCDQGLAPSQSLLDVGCGSLRGGRFFIDYLDPGNYCGFDLSEGVVEAGRRFVASEGLSDKAPDLRVNTEKTLDFGFVSDRQFDYILAQSVFSHLLPDHIEECFDNIRKVMRPDARFFFTYHPGETHRRRSHTDFEYPDSFFEDLASRYSFEIFDLSKEYAHPRGQRLQVIRPAQ